MLIPDPDFYPSRIQKQQLKRGVKKKLLSYIFCSHKFHKIENYFIFEMPKKKIGANFQRIIELFTPKIVTKLSKIWVWDPRSGIQRKRNPDPGSRGHKGTGSRIRIRNTGPGVNLGAGRLVTSFCVEGIIVCFSLQYNLHRVFLPYSACRDLTEVLSIRVYQKT
jgi:hypothetical protein